MPASSSLTCSREPASTPLPREKQQPIQLVTGYLTAQSGVRFCEIVNGHETIETIRNITRKNLAVTPTITNAELLADQFSNLPSYLQRPGRDAPLRVVLYLRSRAVAFPPVRASRTREALRGNASPCVPKDH